MIVRGWGNDCQVLGKDCQGYGNDCQGWGNDCQGLERTARDGEKIVN